MIPLRLSREMSAANAAIQRRIHGSKTTALITSKEEMEDMMEIVKSLKESGLLIKVNNKTIKQLKIT